MQLLTFLGGNISPGISMRLQAMHYFTEKLPLVEKKFNENLIGQNTEKPSKWCSQRRTLGKLNRL